MSNEIVTDEEKLKALEDLVQHFRFARRNPTLPEYPTYMALVAAAEDLQARNSGKVGEARRELGVALEFLERSRDGAKFGTGCLSNVALQLRKRWPVVREALRLAEKAANEP